MVANLHTHHCVAIAALCTFFFLTLPLTTLVQRVIFVMLTYIVPMMTLFLALWQRMQQGYQADFVRPFLQPHFVNSTPSVFALVVIGAVLGAPMLVYPVFGWGAAHIALFVGCIVAFVILFWVRYFFLGTASAIQQSQSQSSTSAPASTSASASQVTTPPSTFQQRTVAGPQVGRGRVMRRHR